MSGPRDGSPRGSSSSAGSAYQVTTDPAICAEMTRDRSRTVYGAHGNQIWPLKLLGTTVALAGAFLFLFAAGSLLLRTRAFATLARPVPEYRGRTGARWWIGALVTTAVGPLLYLWVWKHMFLTTWLAANSLWPQTFTNVFVVWSVIVGLIGWALIALNHVTTTRKQGATLTSYGLTESSGRVDWSAVGRSALLVVAVLAPVYVVLTVVAGAWHVDFRRMRSTPSC